VWNSAGDFLAAGVPLTLSIDCGIGASHIRTAPPEFNITERDTDVLFSGELKLRGTN
jgi:hypothetical protein